jgi:hypothetical protein
MEMDSISRRRTPRPHFRRQPALHAEAFDHASRPAARCLGFAMCAARVHCDFSPFFSFGQFDPPRFLRQHCRQKPLQHLGGQVGQLKFEPVGVLGVPQVEFLDERP